MLPSTSIAVGVAAGVGVLYATSQIVRALLAQRWDSVEGELAGVRLVHRSSGDALSGSADYSYISYRYHVAGRPYRNDRLRFGPQVAPSSPMPAIDPEPRDDAGKARLAARYPTGSPVRVYYNPRNPADSVLYRAPNAAVWVILVACLIFGYAALWGGR